MDKITNLKDLPSIWKDRQSITTVTKPEDFLTEDQIDGSSMTINPEIKHRRKRIMSQINYKTKRPHIAEFINACKFIAGETTKMFPISTQHLGILSLLRQGKEPPEKYQSVINNNYDTVMLAASFKPRQIKEKYNVQPIEKETQTVTRTPNAKNIKTSQEAAAKLEQWLLANMNDEIDFEDKPRDSRYASIVAYYKNHNGKVPSYMPKCSKELLDKYASSLTEFKTKKKRLVRISGEPIKSDYTYAKKDLTSTLNTIEQLKQQQTLEIVETKSETHETKPIMKDFIEYLKSLGVTEFSIKF